MGCGARQGSILTDPAYKVLRQVPTCVLQMQVLTLGLIHGRERSTFCEFVALVSRTTGRMPAGIAFKLFQHTVPIEGTRMPQAEKSSYEGPKLFSGSVGRVSHTSPHNGQVFISTLWIIEARCLLKS